MEKEDKGKKVYSHSRLWLYENCPEAFKAKYIDKNFPELAGSVEAFLGSMVHEALEWLYQQVRFVGVGSVSMDGLVEYYAKRWKNNFYSDLRMNNGGSEESYFNKGIKFLVEYYQRFTPFDENTIDIEKRILFPLDEEGEYFIQGYIDRIVRNEKTGEYEVHDYKTNAFMKKQEQVDKDRQLAFYHLGLQELYGKDIQVKLVWHFLAHNRDITSRRVEAELQKLKQETLNLIKKIETTKEWKACRKSWCDWCAYKKSLENGATGKSDSSSLNRYFK